MGPGAGTGEASRRARRINVALGCFRDSHPRRYGRLLW